MQTRIRRTYDKPTLVKREAIPVVVAGDTPAPA
jgi:hypothetical protein